MLGYFRHLLHGELPIAERERRCRRHHIGSAQPREIRGDSLGERVGYVTLLLVTGLVGKREHDDHVAGPN